MNLYVHIPFCLSKCRYCALYSESGRNDIASSPTLPAKEYLIRNGGKAKVKTAYFGGGTPGILGYDGLKNLVKSLKEAGIDLNDCEKVNDGINDLLDKADYIKEQYFLEVSSPGIERVLKKDKHLEKNIGARVQIKLFKPFNGKKQYEGILKKFDDNNIVIEESEIINIERQNIGQIKTIFDWK